MNIKIQRREFLKGSVGLTGLFLFGCSNQKPVDTEDVIRSELGVYLNIFSDGRVLFETPNAEMGQGTYDALAKILVEELDADWGKVEITLSGANAAMANPKLFGQVTGNSDAVRGYFPVLRNAGAAARSMLIQAAAERWNVPSIECTTENGWVISGSNRASYGDLSEAAGKLSIPENVTLKQASEFKFIGHDFPRKETATKITGEAIFGIDVMLPNMLTAALAMPAEAWGKPKMVDDGGASSVDGVKAVIPVFGGFAVIADDFWTAKTAAEKISVGIEEDDVQRNSSAEIQEHLSAMSGPQYDEHGVLFAGVNGGKDLAVSRVAFRSAISNGKTLKLQQSVPFLAHGALEPLCCTAQFDTNKLTLWAPTQTPKGVHALAVKLSGLPKDSVEVHRTFLGGGFGRKWHTDFIQQSIETAMAMPGRPVKLIWTREQDTQHDFYRPAHASHVEMGFDDNGKITAWKNVIAGKSISKTWSAFYKPEAPDRTLHKVPLYDFKTIHLETRAVDSPVPIGYWRSVSHAHTCFFTEAAIDEAATTWDRDPLEYRLEHLKDERPRRVLKALQELMSKSENDAGTSSGIALMSGYDGFCAVGVQITLADQNLDVNKIWAVADCGLVIDPENAKRQIEGGIFYGLGPALDGKIEFDERKVQSSYFNDSGASSPFAAPLVEIKLLPSDAPPGGIGELGTPAIAPALCNAIAAAGGPRIRDLPISKAGLRVRV